MMRFRRPRQAVLALTLAAISLQSAAVAASDVVPSDYVGKLADGTPVKLSDYAGKAVVLSFWATWCGYCLKELPVLNAIQKSPAKDRIQVIAVNTEDKMTFRDAARELRGLAIKMANDSDKTAQEAFGVNGIPHMVIIGKDGKIIRVYRGYDEAMLGKIVNDINQATGALQ